MKRALAEKNISGSKVMLALMAVLYSYIYTPSPLHAAGVVFPAGPLGAPYRVALYTEDSLLASDYNSGTIFTVNKDDPSQTREEFTIDGNPLAVGYLGSQILVGNSTSGALEVYNSSGALKYSLNGTGSLIFPNDLAVDQKQQLIFLVDSNANQVNVYKNNSQFLVVGKLPWVSAFQRIKLRSSFGADTLKNPVGIALDQEAELVYVSDHGDPMNDIPPVIHIFTYDGLKIDQLGSDVLSEYSPRGIAFNAGQLYVTDALTCEIVVIDLITKTRLGALGEYGPDPGQLIQPQDVTVAPTGEAIYVANKRLGRIEKINTGVLLP